MVLVPRSFFPNTLSMKSILFIRSQVMAPYTGADLSMFDRARLLLDQFPQEFQFQCAGSYCQAQQHGTLQLLRNLQLDPVLTEHEIISYEFQKISVRLFPCQSPVASSQEIEKILTAISFDVLFYDARDISSILASHDLSKKIAFLTENGFLRPADASRHPQGVEVVSYFASQPTVVVATQFLQSQLQSAWNVESHRYVETINVEKFSDLTQSRGQYISCLHPYSHKGIALLLALAELLPERLFLVAAGAGADYRAWKPILEKIPNIHLHPFVTQVESIFRESSIVLVPSICEDNFPRVVMEALASGRPVLASNRGGISEALGDGGLLLPVESIPALTPYPKASLAHWKESLETLSNENTYRFWKENALLRANEYRTQRDADLKRFVIDLL
jgi:glycosyltransferase involved in cell wall biosynthesis